ncbi:MAG TPA: glycosyltransferase family 2 protein [Ramlibacter sp.]|uniref:glycosyltransferase family 2 protein n=1 Tax=Ramlibacter sp. TaxID=1917967 RepID=UPI002D1765BE|nr:glycosyltransferase family 2 protein [Ramlibacter sp.]HVZ46407.1 glycosyltransferase family 2 protein [Ramlibacter sp.]
MQITIAVIIPCYRVKAQVLGVLARIGSEVGRIYVVDDACPERSGDHVRDHCTDPRVVVLRNAENQGVGGAVMAGYAAALAAGADVLVKIDGDGQMDPALIARFVRPIAEGRADYTKGNRFYDLTHIRRMPPARLAGNAVLSFMAKLSTGYWNLFDPTNGFTAIHAKVLRRVPFDKLSRRYFFETDMLFRLSIVRAVVKDVPMDASYGDETSSLRIGRVAGEFMAKHVRNFVKRIAYSYFLRDMTVGSLELVFGTALLAFGVVFGARHWWLSVSTGVAAPLGTIMLAALPTLVGLQLLLAFVGFDVSNVPRQPIHDELPD